MVLVEKISSNKFPGVISCSFLMVCSIELVRSLQVTSGSFLPESVRAPAHEGTRCRDMSQGQNQKECSRDFL